MILYDEIKPHIDKVLDNINIYLKSNNIKGFITLHGTYASGFKNVNKNLQYVTDVDIELWLEYKNKKENSEIIRNFVKYIISGNFYLFGFTSGIDDNFNYNFSINEDGNIVNYDYSNIKTHLDILHKNKYISKNDFDYLIEYVIEEPTIFSAQTLINRMNEYKLMKWSKEDIINGFKMNKNKKIKFENILLESVILSKYIYEYTEGNYVNIDISIHNYDIDNKYKNNINYISKHAKLYGEPDRNLTIFQYENIYKAYTSNLYLKLLKRFRTLLTSYIYSNNKKNKSNINIIKKLRYDIRKVLFKKEIRCLDQITVRLRMIINLIKYKDKLEIKRLTINVINDLVNICKYDSNIDLLTIYNYMNSKNYNKNIYSNKIKTIYNEVNEYLNKLILPYLVDYYDKIIPYINFRLDFQNNN